MKSLVKAFDKALLKGAQCVAFCANHGFKGLEKSFKVAPLTTIVMSAGVTVLGCFTVFSLIANPSFAASSAVVGLWTKSVPAVAPIFGKVVAGALALDVTGGTIFRAARLYDEDRRRKSLEKHYSPAAKELLSKPAAKAATPA